MRYYPLVVESANDCIVKDVDGNEYIDLNSGIACMNVGHNHPRVVEAIKSQCDRFLHYSNTDFYYKEVINLAEKLAKIAPGEFEKKTYFGNSGTEAVEAAVKTCSMAHTQTLIHRLHRRFSWSHYGFIIFHRQQTSAEKTFFSFYAWRSSCSLPLLLPLPLQT